MNAAQPPLQHGPGQPHDLQPHPPPMMSFQAQQMRGPIMPPASGGPFQPGPQPSLYPQHRPVPAPNGMLMAQPMPRMMVSNGIPPSAMVSASMPFPGHPNAVRRPMPPYHQFPPNVPAPNHPLGPPPMFRPGDDPNKMIRMRVTSAPTVPGPMGPLALSSGAIPGANHAIMANNLLPASHQLPPQRQSVTSPARSPRSQPTHSAAQTPSHTGPGGYAPAGNMTPAAPTPRPQTAGPSYQQTPRPSMAGLPPQMMDQSMPMEGLARDAPADVVMQNPGPSQTPRPMSQTGSLSGAPTVREMSLARDSTHAQSPPHMLHPLAPQFSKAYASSQVMALSADLNTDAPGKDTDEYWRRIVSKHFSNEAVMTISLPKEGLPAPNHLGHTAIARTFKAIWMSGIQYMSFSIDGAREHEERMPDGPRTSVLHCTQARWRMHYFSGYMVELHGTLKVKCMLSNGERAWRVQIQQFDLECRQSDTWLSKNAIIFARFLEPMQARSAMTTGVGPDAESNRYLRRGEVVVPATPSILHGLPVSAVQAMEMHDVLSDMASVMDYDAVYRCGPRAAMQQIVNGAPIPQLFPPMPNAFHPLYPPSNPGQLGYSFPPQALPLHQHLQAPQQQQQLFQQHFGPPLPGGLGMGQMAPPPGANDPASQRPLAQPPSTSVHNPEPGPPSMSGPLPITGPTSAAPTPTNATPKQGKRAPGSPSKDQRKRGEAETPAGNEAGPERTTFKRKAPAQHVGDGDTPLPKRRKPRK